MRASFLLSIAFLWCYRSPAIGQAFASVETYAGNGSPGLVNGTYVNCAFHAPYDIAEGSPPGTYYVADALNHCVRMLSGGVTTVLAGNGTVGDQDGQGLTARFHTPTGICYHAGYLYVTDNGNNKIKRVDTLGNVLTIAGTGVAGCTNGPALVAEFNNPVGIATDTSGTIYVADYGNAAIRTIDSGTVALLAGVCGSPGDLLGPVLSARFDNPSDIEVGPNGELYVVDQSNHKIKVITPGGQVDLLAGSGSNASIDGVGATASFSGPAFIDTYPNGNLIVTDWMGGVIRCVSPAGAVSTVAGSGIQGFINGPASSARFNVPYGICCSTSGMVIIGDNGNDVLRRLIPENLPVNLAESPPVPEPGPLYVRTGPFGICVSVAPSMGIGVSMDLLDVAGKAVVNRGSGTAFDSTLREFHIAHPPSGLYIVVVCGSGGTAAQKLVVP